MMSLPVGEAVSRSMLSTRSEPPFSCRCASILQRSATERSKRYHVSRPAVVLGERQLLTLGNRRNLLGKDPLTTARLQVTKLGLKPRLLIERPLLCRPLLGRGLFRNLFPSVAGFCGQAHRTEHK
jgi:hypothetical protein